MPPRRLADSSHLVESSDDTNTNEASPEPKGKRGTKKRYKEAKIYMLDNTHGRVPELKWEQWDHADQDQATREELLNQAARVSLERDTLFKHNKLSQFNTKDFRSIARTCSVKGCEYSSEMTRKMKKEEFLNFMFGRIDKYKDEHNSIISTGIKTGVSRCLEHSDREKYPYPHTKLVGWSGCSNNEVSARCSNAKEHGSLVPVWETFEDDETLISTERLWHIANEYTKTITATCSNRDAAMTLYRLRRQMWPQERSAGSAVDQEMSAQEGRVLLPLESQGDPQRSDGAPLLQAPLISQSEMPPPSRHYESTPLIGRSVQEDSSGLSSDNPHVQNPWNAAHAALFAGKDSKQVALTLNGLGDWSCWSCERPVGNFNPTESVDDQLKWMSSNRYNKAMDGYAQLGTFVCDSEACQNSRRDFMAEEGYVNTTCASLKGCSTKFNRVYNDDGQDYFKVIAQGNPEVTYWLCSQPCTAATSLALAEQQYLAQRHLDDARALQDRSMSRGRKRNRDGRTISASRASSTSGISATTTGTLGISNLEFGPTPTGRASAR